MSLPPDQHTCSCNTKCRDTESVADKLFAKVSDPPPTGGRKVTVVGSGQVGMACVFGLLCKNVTNEICIVDVNKDKLMGESLDLQHGSSVLGDPKISASDDFCITKDSKICIITAGVRQEPGESRLSLVQRNTDVMKVIIPQLVKHSPDTILLLVSNPVDIMTYVAWKLSGLPKHRVIGSGTSLDTSRFRHFIAERLNCASNSCHGWIIGEHGDSSVPVWSGVSVAGVPLRALNPKLGTPEDTEQWGELHKRVISAAYEVIKLKGYTNWAIGLCSTMLTAAILDNSNRIIPVSTAVMGHHGIDKDVFLSLPCMLNSNGVSAIVKQNLDESERQQLQKAAQVLAEVQDGIKF